MRSLLVIMLILSSCSLFDDNGIVEPDDYQVCDMEMDINGEPWSEIHPDDETLYTTSSSYIGDPVDHHDFEDSPMRIGCTRYYKNNFRESFSFIMVIPEEYSTSDLASHQANFQKPEFPDYERVSLWEWEYDFGVARYETDTTQTAYLKITEVDTVKERFTGTFEATLFADENNIDSGRLPDTLNITNGEFEVEYRDSREQGD